MSLNFSMEIPVSWHQSSFLDRLAARNRILFSISPDFGAFSGRSFLSADVSHRRRPTFACRCSSSTGQGLRPRPHQIGNKELASAENASTSGENACRNKRTVSRICGQIEKLTLHKRYHQALDLFEVLDGDWQLPATTYDALVSVCIGLKLASAVKKVWNHMAITGFEPDQYFGNRVLLMHVKCGMMFDARRLFEEMPQKNLASWNTITAGLVDSGDYQEAFELFFSMWEEFSEGDSRLFATAVRSSACLELVSLGQQLHACILKMGVSQDIFVSCALINMYGKCGSIEDAQFVFDDMPEKTPVAWNSLIAGYGLRGYAEEALSLFYEMRDSGVYIDQFTISIVLRICTRLGLLEHAKQAHAGLIRNGFSFDVVACTALVDLYSKWGRIEDARHVFDNMPKKNVISWNSLIHGYRNHGRGQEAVEVFEQMVSRGLKPNHITFLGVLSACSRSGLSEHGWEIFQSMVRDHKVRPRPMHYACMVELLGREGLLDEAFALIRNAPFKPTANIWAALLTACRVHENFELGKLAAEKLYGMEPEKLSNYIVLLNIYNRLGKTKEAAEVVHTLRKKGLMMQPACTWIEINQRSHGFLSGDKSYAQTKEIYEKVEWLMGEISERYGYVPHEKFVLPDVDEREVGVANFHHSEKLAVAFGLINTQEWTRLQLVQSHRMCKDCHIAIKLIAAVTGREVVMRDGSRFHHFKDGDCSCGDYW